MEEEQNLDLICYYFNEELTELINKYGKKMPASIVSIMVKDILNQIDSEKDRIIANLLSERQEERTETIELPVEEIKEEE